MALNDFFKTPTEISKKLKIFVWGSFGTGKTTFSMQFPRPLLIDMDGGSKHYSEQYKVPTLVSSSIVDIKNAIATLLKNENEEQREYDTLILDPVTEYYGILHKFWSDVFLKRLQGIKAHKHEFFEFGPLHWATLKEDFKTLFRKLIDLDMHVIATARETTSYKEGSFMVADGVKFDCEKGMPYWFDIVIQLFIDKGKKYMAICTKDRTKNLPINTPFEFSYEIFSQYFQILKEKTNA